MSHSSEFEIRIRPSQSWLRLDLRALWEFRDLLWLFVRRDFVARYRQTALGSAWAVVQPLIMTLVFTLVFGRFAGISTDGLPPTLFYLCGLLAWNYHAQTLQQTGLTFTANAQLFGKVYFPRLIVPFSVAISNVIAFGIHLALFAGFWLYFKLFTGAGQFLSLHWAVFALPLLLLQIALVSVGAGLLVSASTAKYRDLQHVLPLVIQIWLYLTPVIYPLSKVPERYQWLGSLNPLAAPVEMFRFVLLGEGAVSPASYVLSVAFALVLFLAGLFLFRRTERTFIDTV